MATNISDRIDPKVDGHVASECTAFHREIPTFLKGFANVHTVEAYRRPLYRYLTWALENDVDPLRVSRDGITAYEEQLRSSLKLSSIKHHFAVLRSFADHLQGRGLTGGLNWWHVYHLPVDPDVRHSAPIPPEELPDLYRKAEALGSRALLMVKLMFEAGLRREDSAQLRRSDLMKTPKGSTLRLVHSGRPSRHVQISPGLAGDIERELRMHADSPWLFPGYKGQHIALRQVNRIMRAIAPRFHPHRLRVSHMAHGLARRLRVEDLAHTLLSTPGTVLRHEGPSKSRRKSTVGLTGPGFHDGE